MTKSMSRVDGILIPGGGLLQDGSLPPWTMNRLDRSLELIGRTRWIGLLSGGTVHKPPPLDEAGFPVFESHAAANYLLRKGLNADQILIEICSYDTIGNAYFSRLLFAEPLKMTRILVVTSAFHITRIQAAFEWVYDLLPQPVGYDLFFESVPDLGLSPNVLNARLLREKNSLAQLLNTRKTIGSLSDFTRWLYSEHAAYTPGLAPDRLSEDELKTY
jgi:uncharacterized SAM-binding protein YcdF (DUF218 family)